MSYQNIRIFSVKRIADFGRTILIICGTTLARKEQKVFIIMK